MKESLQALGLALLLALCAAAAARGQQLLDWTLRTRVEPEALATGTEAVFWNPAGIGVTSERGQAMVAALQSSDDVGLKGLGAAVSFRLLGGGTALGLGYQHLGIDDIGRTGAEPPDQGAADLMAVTEDRLTLGAVQPLGRARLGVQLKYDGSQAGLGTQAGLSFGAGVLMRADGRLAPEAGAALLALAGSLRWRVGIGATLPLASSLPAAVRVSYGLSGQSDRAGWPAERLAVTGDWHRRVLLSLAALAESSDGTTVYTPEGVAQFRVGRYVLGVLRDALPNGFGAATTVNLGMSF